MESGGKFVIIQGEEPGTSDPTPRSTKEIEHAEAEYVSIMEMALLGLDESLPPTPGFDRVETFVDYDGRWQAVLVPIPSVGPIPAMPKTSA